jgi:SH3 domain-containing YSC84-like protein 1
MTALNRIRRTAPIALVAGALSLVACGGSQTVGQTQTTAGRVDSEKAKALERLDSASDVIDSLRDKIPPDAVSRAQCVIAFPSVAKGGIIVGGATGNGYATCKTMDGWSAPTPVSLSGGSFGAQIGFEEADVLALVTTRKGTRGLATGNFRVGADASAAAGPIGRGRGGGTDMDENADMISYSRSRGLFAGINLDGSVIKLDRASARGLYKEHYEASLFLGGSIAAPRDAEAQNFLATVRGVFGDGRAP